MLCRKTSYNAEVSWWCTAIARSRDLWQHLSGSLYIEQKFISYYLLQNIEACMILPMIYTLTRFACLVNKREMPPTYQKQFSFFFFSFSCCEPSVLLQSICTYTSSLNRRQDHLKVMKRFSCNRLYLTLLELFNLFFLLLPQYIFVTMFYD